jgi:hypothetical protein
VLDAMRKPRLLPLAFGAILFAPLIDGHAGRMRVELRIQTSRSDVSIVPDADRAGLAIRPAAASSLVLLEDAGRPALPYRIVEVLIPNGERIASITATARATETIATRTDVAPALARSAPSGVERSPNAPSEPTLAPENGGDTYPAELVRHLGTGTWHGHSIASVAVFPVRVTGDGVVLHSNIEVRIELAPAMAAPSEVVVRPLRASPRTRADIESALRARVLNGAALETYAPIASTPQRGAFAPSSLPSEDGSPVEYLIVTSSALAPSFQVLADWKTAKGVPTQVRTVDWIEANSRRGSDLTETLRFFLQDAYANWGVKYVLLAGDTPEIPPRYLYSSYYYGGTLIPADIYFACLDGTFNADGDTQFGEQPVDSPDLYPELIVGRVPVSSPLAADVVVGKIIAYETPLDTEYTDKVLLLAEVLFPAPWSQGPIALNGADATEVVRTLYAESPSRRVTPMYETPWLYPGSVQESRAYAVDSLEAGYNQVFHVGHGFRFNMHCGDDNIAIPDADALSHADRYFNLYMLNCTAAAFDYDCLGEHLLRNPAGGAVSVVGAVNSAFAEISALYLNNYAQALYADGFVHLGEALSRSRLARTPIAEFGDNADLWTHYIYTVLGDPEMPIWTGPARLPVVTLPDSVPAGDSLIPVHVAVDGIPVASARVCLRKGDEDYRVADTDVFGSVSVPFSASTGGAIDVVVTGINLVRTAHTVDVTGATGPVFDVDVASVDDDSLGGTSGNGDGILDAGEVVDLFPSLQNFGSEPTPAMSMLLQSLSPYVTVLDTAAGVGDVGPSNTAVAGDAWRIAVSDSAPDARLAPFDVTLTDGVVWWNESISLVLHAPDLEMTGLRKSDAAPVGNGDGIVTNGEEFRLFCTFKNFGSGTARGLTARLRALDGGTTVLDSLDSFADAGPLVAVENALGFRLSETDVSLENPLEIVVTDARGVELHHTIELRAPIPPLITSFNPGLGVDKMSLAWSPSASPDAQGYHVYRSTAAAGPFVRASADVVSNTLFTDAGLTASTRYYYAVTALDLAGNESAFSPIGTASTTPPQLTGWPNALPDPSANSPTIGDIDRDGDLDVVVGNDRMYAWQFDGLEVTDGDGQALTWGVLSPLGDDFIGPSALADFDDVPGLDIAAAAYTSKEVYIFNHAGDPLPGWPQPTVDFVRASVAIGNLDGVGGFEVVAIDQEAYLYAWHADGTELFDGDADPATNGVLRRFPDTNQWQYQSTAIADLDGDGRDEVIVATQDKKLYVLDETGQNEPGWPRTLLNFAGGGVAVGDIDANGDLELVVTTRNSGETYALNHDNTVIWTRWLSCNLFFNPSPALADLTGDGKLEALIASSNGRMYAVQYNGSDAPGWPVVYSTTTNTESSPVVGDVSGDGVVDVLLGDEGKTINGWSATGAILDGFPLVMKDSVRGTPAITDLDLDGDVEVVAIGYDKAVYVWDFTTPYDDTRMPWPMHRSNVHRNGRHGFDAPTPVTGALPPSRLLLGQNYPNPFNPTTTIAFEVPAAGRASLVVYDVTGARVRTLVDGTIRAGRHDVKWDGRNESQQPVGSGVYFYRLATTGKSLTRKMVLLK